MSLTALLRPARLAATALAILIAANSAYAQTGRGEPRPLSPSSNRACLEACASVCRVEAERCRMRDARNAGSCAARANLCRLNCTAGCR